MEKRDVIELKDIALVFSFREVHEEAVLRLDFQRTLRIPDDDKTYPLPPGLGRFPLRHVDDFARRVPGPWLQRGGVILPMYQSEAMWLNFNTWWRSGMGEAYPFAVKVAAGKINALTGEEWQAGLQRHPQNYLVTPRQPWLDGYCVEKGLIRQFVAMPRGAGYTAAEQITGAAAHGGLQIEVIPMRPEVYERRFPQRTVALQVARPALAPQPAMGLAPGGRMRQQIYADPFDFSDWDVEHSSRCYVHIANSLVWRAITGRNPPTPPPTAEEYSRAGLPWFEYYAADAKALDGLDVLAGLKSILQVGDQKGEVPLPENEAVTPQHIVHLRERLSRHQVREATI
jgi:hypothetical protein